MLFRKTLVRATVLALLAAPASVAVATETLGSASAATTPVATTTTISIYNQSTIEYGSGRTALIEGAVKAADGSSVSHGTLTLQASAYPFTTWTTLYTSGPSLYYSHTVNPKISTRYRLVYSGYTSTDPTNSYDESYVASTSSDSPIQVVSRKLLVKSKGLHLMGKVSPAAKLKVVFKKKVHGKYRTWFTTHTNKKGKFDVHLHAARGTQAAIVVAARGGYAGAVEKGSIV